MSRFANYKSIIVVLSTIGSLAIGTPIKLSEEAISTTPSKAAGMSNCPRIVSRSEWRARSPTEEYLPMVVSPSSYVVAHHGGIPHYCYDETTCANIVRSYQDLHMDVNTWADIGYHFVIGGDGNVYEGRGWDHVGAHCPGYNGQGIGICIIGDYTSRMPNNASLEAFQSLIDCGISLGKVKPDYKLIGHRQGRDTQCPGETFYAHIKTMPHWEPNPVPLWGVSGKGVFKPGTKTANLTGTQRWTGLIALGVPMATSTRVGDGTIAEKAALNAAKKLIKCGVDSGKINKTYVLLAHKQVAQTACPGNKLFNVIKK
ncbi:peptidoglycan-recognition protein SC2 [Neodiprion lecontei]|uniref:Peptidoglycan-recognition protein SC2 n=1 Tax=Neodiprion lecontei TaxID=441921 RepID=A0A6J0B2A6_NEOLC|nr:peptidoglycan-recognition protein SC2 [Neodiprion lecontei]